MDRKAQLRSYKYDYIKDLLDKDKQLFIKCLLNSFLPMAILGVKKVENNNPIASNVYLLVQDVRPRWIQYKNTMSLYTYVTPVKRKPRQKKVYGWGTFDPRVAYVDSP